jgi:hypothetical protein
MVAVIEMEIAERVGWELEGVVLGVLFTHVYEVIFDYFIK